MYVISGYWIAGYVISDSQAAVVSNLQGVAPSAIIELFQLELNQSQHGVNETYYFHAGVNGASQAIVWAGQEYMALPIEADGFAWNGQGTLPRPTLRVANALGTITTLLLTLPDGLEGAKVTRIRTLARYLDEFSYVAVQYVEVGYAESGDEYAEWPREVYYIDRMSNETPDVVEFELCSIFDLAGIRAPKRQCITRCQWKYRSAECSYNDNKYFDSTDKPVANLSQDVCGKRISSCEARFGVNRRLPFGGYPGIGAYSA
jgi:lambda family phage minor tail protein L